MRLLVDAQLPRRLAHRLRDLGHDALHTLDLPGGNRTADAEIARLATEESRVVVTKDADFVASHLLGGLPPQLLLLSTGNLSNRDLEARLLPRLDEIAVLLESAAFVEVTRDRIVVHG